MGRKEVMLTDGESAHSTISTRRREFHDGLLV
jgi:hypothetical protein